jgi:hypothetical protein
VRFSLSLSLFLKTVCWGVGGRKEKIKFKNKSKNKLWKKKKEEWSKWERRKEKRI